MFYNQLSWRTVFAVFTIVGVLIVSCSSQTATISTPQPLSIPQGAVTQVTWLDDNQIVFLYAAVPEANVVDPLKYPDRWQYELYSYGLNTKKWNELHFRNPTECVLGWIDLIERLPNGDLGVSYQCNISAGGGRRKELLFELDPSTGTQQILEDYPELFAARVFSFAPDMKKLVQDEFHGGKTDKVFMVMQDGQMNQILPDYARARSPSWSSDGRIVLGANKSIPDSRSNPLTALVGIGDIVFYPWDLYLLDANNSNPKVILSNIVGLDFIKWSSDSKCLAFWGNYKGQDGIWLFNPADARTIQLWPRYAAYDWSPDGQSVIILDREKQTGPESFHPLLLHGISCGS